MVQKTLESPFDCKEIKPVNLKGNQPWIFIEGTDVEVDAPIIWPLDVKCQIIGKDPDVGKDWRQEEKGTTGDEMVGWHHWLDGHEFEQALGVGDGQGSLVCCSPWGHNESDTTEQLNWGELLLGRKAMTNLHSVLKNRDLTLPTNVHMVKAMVYLVITNRCDSWTIKKAEHQRIDDLNCGVEEYSWESLGLQGDQTNQS